MKELKEKLVIFFYALLVSLVPPAPNLYTATVSALGLFTSTLAAIIMLMYLWTRPPIQQTLVQPVLILTGITCVANVWKSTIIGFLGNCAPVFFQYIFDKYPLWLCGCLNNHLNFGIVAYCLVILGISKLVLLFRPMEYHSANHDQIVRYIFLALAIVVMCDNLLYFVFSNKYYCHSGTILREAAIYKRSVNVTLIKEQTVHIIFSIWDFSIFVSLIIIEIANLTGTLYKTKKNEIIQRINNVKQCGNEVQPRPAINQPRQNQGQPLSIAGLNDMYPQDRNVVQINNFTGNSVNLHPPSHLDENRENSGNRRILLMVAIQTGLIFLQREGVYGTTFLYDLYTRFVNYVLSIIWVTGNPNFRAYALVLFDRWKSRFTNQEP